MEAPRDPTRRNVLTGRLPTVHISSAVVSVLPVHRENVVRLLSDMDGVEVHHQSSSKIVIVLESRAAQFPAMPHYRFVDAAGQFTGGQSSKPPTMRSGEKKARQLSEASISYCRLTGHELISVGARRRRAHAKQPSKD